MSKKGSSSGAEKLYSNEMKNFRRSYIIPIAVVLSVVFLPSFIKWQFLMARKRSLDKNIEALKRENRSLAAEEVLLKRDPAYVEKVAREKLKVAKPGEIILKMPKDDN